MAWQPVIPGTDEQWTTPADLVEKWQDPTGDTKETWAFGSAQWILETAFWRDLGFWIDVPAVWKDYPDAQWYTPADNTEDWTLI